MSIARGQKKPPISVSTEPGFSDRGRGNSQCSFINNEKKDVCLNKYREFIKRWGQSAIDELKEVNLDTIKEPRPNFISAQLSDDDENEYVSNQTRASANQASPMTILTRTHFSNRGRGHEALSFMDGSSRYNQIQMALDDVRRKQHSKLQKSKKKFDHLEDLKLILDCLKKYQLRMNPLKCAFNITSGKLLRFIVRHCGVEVDHSKIEAIQKMPSSKNLNELR
ncbi:uncharacterized protein E5676_scaffold447G00650 [Cucumis melo var. makuwa]|uniref:Uncharacterized protein n=1 Tax=Cucumis melo var. makuwa TaxID=1194695 RepID=A0A5D3CCT6_CUCMM|nr:uncharacterized protein E6C27_scaffold34G00410 [Cucumis melo var. makuwa]TYK09663.1 uncharacterized protein E5676_scaffold447G00650 [Cucumis melo var. makuwa]